MSGHWGRATLAQVCSLITDGTHHSPANGPVGDFLYVTAKNIRRHGLDLSNISYIDKVTHDAIYTRCPVEQGDVLYIKDGVTAGLAAINHLTQPFSLLSSVALLKPRPGVVHGPYLKHWLNSPETVSTMTGSMTGSAIKRLVLRQIRTAQMPLPPPSEQARIADKLDKLLARIDACRDRLDRLPSLIDRLRQSALTSAIRGSLTADWRATNGGVVAGSDAEIDEPTIHSVSGWTYERADKACSKVQSGGTPREGFISAGGAPFLKVYNLVGQQVDFAYRPQFIDDEIHRGLMRKSITLPGDVLMNIVGPPLGKVAVVSADFPQWNINQAITLFRAGPKVLSEWLYFVLCEGSAVRHVMPDTRGSVGQVNISLSQCRAFVLPVPPIDEQREAIRRLRKLFGFAQQLSDRLRNAEAAVNRLTPAVLAKAFRGELVPQDPADEPAERMLERLRTTEAPKAAARRRRSAGRDADQTAPA